MKFPEDVFVSENLIININHLYATVRLYLWSWAIRMVNPLVISEYFKPSRTWCRNFNNYCDICTNFGICTHSYWNRWCNDNIILVTSGWGGSFILILSFVDVTDSENNFSFSSISIKLSSSAYFKIFMKFRSHLVDYTLN